MSRFTTERLTDIADDAGLNYEPYSGRGMSGKECFAVTADSEREAFAKLVAACESTDEAAQLIREARSDSMGLSKVIYWPHVAAEVV